MSDKTLSLNHFAGDSDDFNESDLIQDLRNLIVTDDSESLQEMLSIIGALQAKLEDRQGLVNMLKPVIITVLAENIKDHPDQLRQLLRPIIADILNETDSEATESAPKPAKKRPGLFKSIRRKAQGLFAGLGRKDQAILKEPTQSTEQESLLYDGEFALFELFLLAKPSLVLLAHGAWESMNEQNYHKEHLLPLLRSFIQNKVKEKTGTQPLTAHFDRFQVHIEPSQHAYLVVFYEGKPPVGFMLDVRQALADLQNRFTPALKRAQSITPYRSTLRLLLDRYRPTESRLGASTQEDPLTWPPSQDTMS